MDSLSDKNPLIKQIRRAVSHGSLTDDGYAVAEGPHLLEDAIRAGCEIKVVVAGESSAAELVLPSGTALRTVSDKTFQELSSTDSPQGVIALVKPPSTTVTALVSSARPLIVILDGVQIPGNAGAILRSAEAFGATGAIFLKGTVNPYNPKCMRGSAGSIFRLPVVSGLEVDDLPGLPLFAAMPHASVSIDTADFRDGCGIVIGSEGSGVRPQLAARATAVSIPTKSVESLNAAVAAAVILYEASRQRARR